MEGCKQAEKDGFTAIGHLTPFLDVNDRSQNSPFQSYAGRIEEAIDHVRQYREAVGDDVDLCIEIHRRCGISDAIALARGIEKYHPYFYEDQVKPDNFDDMEQVAKKVHIPIATRRETSYSAGICDADQERCGSVCSSGRMRVRWYYRCNEDCCNGRSLWSRGCTA